MDIPLNNKRKHKKVEISSVNIKMKKENKKKIIILVIIICCVIVVGFIGFKVYKNEQAKKKLQDMKLKLKIILII